MNKIKNVVLAVLFSFFGLTSLNAFQVPSDTDGAIAKTVKALGVYVLGTDWSSTAVGVAGSSIAIYGYMTSTATTAGANEFLEIRATNTANTSSELLVPSIVTYSTNANTIGFFDPPIIAPEGVSINNTVGTIYSCIFYRYLSTNTNDGVQIPVDNYQGVKVEDSGFYGVKAATEVSAGAVANTVGSEGLNFNSGEHLLEDESGFLYGWSAGTQTVADARNFVVFHDTNSALGTTPNSQRLMPPIFYTVMDNPLFISGSRNPYTAPFSFPWPVRFRNGLTQTRTFGNKADQFRVFTKPARRLR